MAFGNLSERLKHIFAKLTGSGKLTEVEINAAAREVKLALLEADVNFLVVKKFIAKISEKALGERVMQSLTPGQQVIKIVHEEMTELLGTTNEKLAISPMPPSVYLMCGLQGAGKTTFCGKFAHMLKSQGKRVLLVACDVYRPAAVDQLKVVAKGAGCEVYDEGKGNPVKIAANGVKHATKNGFDTVIIDTAGRLHIDNELMVELSNIKKETKPIETLLTVDAMTGQDAVNTAKKFDEEIGLTGVLLTKLDGDARGGAALSIRSVTGKPIKFCGIGEKIGDIEPFHPERIASRILGMGDVLTIIEKAKVAVSEQEALAMEKKMRGNSFTLEDFLHQYENIKKMGNLDQIMESMGGAFGGKMKFDGKIDERQILKNKAIIQSMTPFERRNPDELKASRKRRIAAGAGATIQEVNSLLKQYEQSKQMMRQLASPSMRKKLGAGMR
ncbi:MAG: signal recognition particle protein [Firmicutes bacterium]|nr:signal recognition particle protein [Bacillota bacterium]